MQLCRLPGWRPPPSPEVWMLSSIGVFALGGIAASLLFLLGFIKNWFWIVPVITAFALSDTYGPTALFPGLFVGFLLNMLIAFGIGFVEASRGEARRA